MKFLAFALMPTKKGHGQFLLADLMQESYRHLIGKLNEDGYLFYQSFVLDSLEKAKEFFDTLSIENEEDAPEQDQLATVKLNHVVVSVPDDFDREQPLNEIVSEVFVLFPGHYINHELNDAMDQNERNLKALNEQQKAIDEGLEATLDERLLLAKNTAAALEAKHDLEIRWQAYAARPFKVLKGPQFDASTALTPILFHASVINDVIESPRMERQAANAHLRLFVGHGAEHVGREVDNDRTPDASPIMSRKI